MALVVCWALLLTTYLAIANAQSNATLDPSQVYTTNNLVTFDPAGSATTGPWQNVGQWNGSLTCWGPGGPGYCGPNPYVGAFANTINFSYGTTDLYQVVNIANALPYSGTGLRVNGFNFGFTAKNGNGWDDGRLDYLVAYVNLYGADGKVVQSYDYGNYTNQKYGWTPFSFSETFATPYSAKDLSTARYGFVGRDNNFWAGPYGPEVTGVSFSLKYSVDPCYVDVLSSPTCPGYLDKLNSLSPAAPTITVATTPTTSTTATSSSTTVDVTQPNNTVATSSSSNSTPVPTLSNSVTPTATNPQPRVGEITVPGSPAKVVITARQVATILETEQRRIAILEVATTQSAVTQAQAAAQQAQEQSIQISTATVAQSQSSAQAAVQQVQEQKQQINMASALQSQSATQTLPTQLASQVSVSQTQSQQQTPQVVAVASGIRPVTQPAVITLAPTTENSSGEGLKLSFVGPMSNFLNPQPRLPEVTQDTKPGPAVNTQARDNDAASGVNIAAMARTPQGFEAYMGVVPDTKFYDPKEIYRGQRVVDNARVQRAMSGASDRIHQDMVNQQYRKDR